VVGENPYLQLTGAQAMFSSHPLNFDPSAAEMAEIRLKLDNLTLANNGVPAKVILKFMLDEDDTTTGSLFFSKELDIADLDSSEYITVTFPVGDFFDDVEKVTTIYTAVQGVKPAGDNVATITYDYLYVGPRNRDAYFIYFTDESGNNIITYAVSDCETPIVYPGQTPMKEGNNWIHYTFIGWSDAAGNIIDLTSEIFYEDTTLSASFQESAHEYEFSYTDTIHSGICSCGAPYVEEAHQWDNGTITKPVTCTEDGTRTYSCFCGASYSETIAATGHKYITNIFNPTCTERGYTLHVCACGNNYKTNYVDALGHNFIYTANEDDTHTISCANDCKYNVTETHDWDEGEVISNQTCTADGSTFFTCEICHFEKIETYEATGHNKVCVEAKPATCTEPGNNKYYKCESCGKCYLDEDCIYQAPNEAYFQIAATNHKYSTNSVAATCTTGGYIEHTCIFCNDSYKSNETPALGHSYGIPANNGDGTHSAACVTCGDVKTEAHKFVDGSCICGEKEVTGPTVDSSISFGSQLALENDLTMIFRVRTDKLSKYDLSTAYLVVERDMYNSDGTTDVNTMTITESTVENGRLIFNYPGISAAQMNDGIRATLHIKDAAGKEYVSPVQDTSVATYLDALLLASTSNAKMVTLIIDMVNYGAAAQVYFNRHADAPVNMAFDSFKKYASYASTDFRTQLEDMTSQIPVAGATAALSQTLDLGTRIGISYKAKLPAGVDPADAKLVIKDASGKELAVIDLSTGELDSKNRYVVIFDGSTTTDMRRVVYATIMVNGVAISNTYTYSISSYAYSLQQNTSLAPDLANLTKMMVLYGDSAADLFG
ncbi:MAG: hypothetical protein IKW10_04795, partial [Oscillospiraceae bacterium]|nr:hypothetical protein [Oscillospiraceae bacterium]